MRFETLSALGLGVLLPILETVRRGMAHWRIDFTTMLEDYLAGALLFAAGVLSAREHRFARPAMVAAWAYVTAIMTGSLVSQIESAFRGTDLEPRHTTILLVKLLLWLTCVMGLAFSFRRDLSTPIRSTPPAGG